MIVYVRLPGIGALHLECGIAYGGKPFFAASRFQEEFIFDLPFCRLIFTPARVLRRVGAAEDIAGKALKEDKGKDENKDETPDHGCTALVSGASES